MNTTFKNSLLNNKSNIDMYIQPNEERLLEEDFNISLLNFTWEVTSFHEKELKIKLNMTNPLYISTETVQDLLVININ